MSEVLVIRHLPNALALEDKEQLLKHFGAEKVWESSSKRNYIFASFGSLQKAKTSLTRLHQLEIGKRRLIVEYSFEKEPIIQSKTDTEQTSSATKLVKEFLKVLNAWNPSVDFYQPPPPHLQYTYPNISQDVAINIIHNLYSFKPFYTQTLHLMNKMSLDNPFKENLKATNFFKDTFREYFIDETSVPLPKSDTESELSSEENEQKEQFAPKLVKRKSNLPLPLRKRSAVVPLVTSAPKKKNIVAQEEIFDASGLVLSKLEPVKIALVVTENALQKPSQEPEVIGELGKFDKQESPEKIEEKQEEKEPPTITKSELVKNRMSHREMKTLPVFKNYHSGQPSMRLYIKNLAKTVTDQDVKRIYRRYVEKLSEAELNGFDVRVMQEGRMKGQAFVTFPSISIAESALYETNGYLLKDKPMVVQFARAANKKSIE